MDYISAKKNKKSKIIANSVIAATRSKSGAVLVSRSNTQHTMNKRSKRKTKELSAFLQNVTVKHLRTIFKTSDNKYAAKNSTFDFPMLLKSSAKKTLRESNPRADKASGTINTVHTVARNDMMSDSVLKYDFDILTS